MQLRSVIERRLRRAASGADVESDVHAVVAANVGERGSVAKVASRQTASADGKRKADRDPDPGA